MLLLRTTEPLTESRCTAELYRVGLQPGLCKIDIDFVTLDLSGCSLQCFRELGNSEGTPETRSPRVFTQLGLEVDPEDPQRRI